MCTELNCLILTKMKKPVPLDQGEKNQPTPISHLPLPVNAVLHPAPEHGDVVEVAGAQLDGTIPPGTWN